MEGLEKMNSDLERVIERDESSTNTSDSLEMVKQGSKTLREKLDDVVHSHRFMIGVVVLVVLDCVMVIAELLFDLEIVKLGEEHKFVPKIFHYASLTILSVFIIEISLRLYVLRLNFLKHKLEVFDAIIVIVSFILDIVFRDNEDASTGIGLLIILRLWRVTRIVNGIIMSVKKQAEKKVEKEKHQREACEEELIKFREYCTAQEAQIELLEGLLKKHNIEFTENPIKRPVCSTTVDVVAEVNRVADKMQHTSQSETGGKASQERTAETDESL